MVYRIYVEKKPEYASEANSLKKNIISFLGIKGLKSLRIINRYDVEKIEKKLFDESRNIVFSEPQLDIVYDEIDLDGLRVFAVEYLPGQFDQRADSAAQCIQLISKSERPTVKTAKLYVMEGVLSENDISEIKKYIINPVESREASLALPETLDSNYELPSTVPILDGFIEKDGAELIELISMYGLAMDKDDIVFCRDYFKAEGRNPTLTELRVIDTYWSDHCRHTTFLTEIDNAVIKDENVAKAFERYMNVRDELNITKPITLMNIGTIAAKYLKSKGILKNLDESDEINACTVKINVDVDGKAEKWLLLFKNETHNHPTEIEPFGGAATCIGGAIRDPLSGRSYVYQAMRVTGGGNPLVSADKTLEGKLPQRQILTTSAAGNSSYGNQIGLATGLVDEIYHDGYLAKHLEIGAVVGAAPERNVMRTEPKQGDVVVLIGGRTGRDGCGGATGSSKSHSKSSIETCGAEVQKGNAPEERKLQRLFRNEQASKLIKRCNDFGAGGVSVAIGELADGLEINLDAIPKKYDGLDGTELAISESQERMAVVLDRDNASEFMKLAENENLEATIVAEVTDKNRLSMDWCGKRIVDISRDFLNSNGATKHADVYVNEMESVEKTESVGNFSEKIKSIASDINVCSKRGLSERFDSTIGAGSVLMPFGGKYQRTPSQVMAAKIPVLSGKTDTCSVMAYGYNPFITEKNTYTGAYLAVVESVSKLICAGGYTDNCYLTFQEYFERLGNEPRRWGKPFSALLGALDAQLDLGLAAIGGKDSMSGSFENIDVPPTLVSFAITTCDSNDVISPEFKKCGSRVVLVTPRENENGLPNAEDMKKIHLLINRLISGKKILSAYTPTYGGCAAAVIKMAAGNRIGFKFSENLELGDVFKYNYGSFVLELTDDCEEIGVLLGKTTEKYSFRFKNEEVCGKELSEIYESSLESVYGTKSEIKGSDIEKISYSAHERMHVGISHTRPKVLIPVFPGTNCEYDTARQFENAGAEPIIEVIKNLTARDVSESVDRIAERIEESQIIFIPGGFSGGDEPEGSAKLIAAFFRNKKIKDCVHSLLNSRDGLIGGICNGFQALIKLGLVPYGAITKTTEKDPTLTFNDIGRHQSRFVNIRVASNKSPWMMYYNVDDLLTEPISHGEGKFVCDSEILSELIKNGQVMTQYCDWQGNPSMDIDVNPNGSVMAIEGITSLDGRVFGKMAHSERMGTNLHKNINGNKESKLFKGAVDYFKII